MNADQRNEIAASVAAHGELGSGYDEAVAQGLVERIGEEIDKRVDARLGRPGGGAAPQPPPYQPPAYAPQYQAPAPPAAPPAHRRSSIATPIIALGSIGMGLGATGIVTSHQDNGGAAFGILLLIWAAIAVINVVYARRR